VEGKVSASKKQEKPILRILKEWVHHCATSAPSFFYWLEGFDFFLL